MPEIVLRRDLDGVRKAIRLALRSRHRTMAMIELTLARIVKAGQALTEYKAELEHGQFEAMLEEQGVIGEADGAVSKETVIRWMRLARFNDMNPGVLDRAQTLTKAYRLAGILPDMDEANSGSSGSCSNYLVHLNRLNSTLVAQFKARPLDQWSLEDKRLARERLLPIVDIFDQLGTP